LKLGKDEAWHRYDRLIAISREGRAESLYVFADAARGGGECQLHMDINVSSCGITGKVRIPAGESAATRPLICLLYGGTLTLEMLTDLDRITF
jgi:hypothetical protein